MKICSKCKRKKSFTAFNKNRTTKDGLQFYCKKCRKEYHQIHKAEHVEYWKKYRRTHKIEATKYKKKYRQTLIGHLHHCFDAIKQRCTDPKAIGYKNYGGRGIKNKFKSFNSFFIYIVNDLRLDTLAKIKKLQIDRINNNGHYEKGNIRFVTSKVNNNNRRNSK